MALSPSQRGHPACATQPWENSARSQAELFSSCGYTVQATPAQATLAESLQLPCSAADTVWGFARAAHSWATGSGNLTGDCWDGNADKPLDRALATCGATVLVSGPKRSTGFRVGQGHTPLGLREAR